MMPITGTLGKARFYKPLYQTARIVSEETRVNLTLTCHLDSQDIPVTIAATASTCVCDQ